MVSVQQVVPSETLQPAPLFFSNCVIINLGYKENRPSLMQTNEAGCIASPCSCAVMCIFK